MIGNEILVFQNKAANCAQIPELSRFTKKRVVSIALYVETIKGIISLK